MKGRYPKGEGARKAPIAPVWPETPSDLGPAARAEWERVVPMLWNRRVIEDLDVNVLRAYCQTAALVWECDRQLVNEGLVTLSSRGVPTQNPIVRTRTQLIETMRKLSIELGLTPLARGRVQPMPEPDVDDPFEAILGGE